MITKIYTDNPNQREVRRVADLLREGGIVVMPTDTLYAFTCSMEFKRSVETIAQLKGFSLKKAKYSMLCSSLSMASEYVRPMDKDLFSLLKGCLPGPYTFIMDANTNVPRNYLNPNKTIGVRVPGNNILQAVVEAVGIPLIGTSVRRVDEEIESEYLTDPELINETWGHRVDMVVDGGLGEDMPSTVVNCAGGAVELIRRGKGTPEGDAMLEDLF
ncbi:MAG: threonylcarbamoyl-AMP synthase [Bacteroidales bacterium]|nr:threonylcarbamoyl-AMP synthase [Bacteroidales bacterium]